MQDCIFTPEFTDMDAAEVLRYLGTVATRDMRLQQPNDCRASGGHRGGREIVVNGVSATGSSRAPGKRRRNSKHDPKGVDDEDFRIEAPHWNDGGHASWMREQSGSNSSKIQHALTKEG